MDQIYEDYYQKVFSYINSRINNYHDSEDLCEDVFGKVFRNIESFDSTKSALSTWIFNITRNTLIDFYRTRHESYELLDNYEYEGDDRGVSDTELADLARECVSRGIYIMADEVYERICFMDEFVSMASIPEARDLTILINGLSKSIPMTGWRIGYTATEAGIAKAIGSIQGHITSHPSMISQWAGVDARDLCGDYTEMMVSEDRKRMEAAVAFLREELPEAPFIEPQGAFYLFIDISCVKDAMEAQEGASGFYSKDFTMKLLNEKHVAVAPGSAFGMDGFVRIAYASDISDIMEGLRRIRDLIRELSPAQKPV